GMGVPRPYGTRVGKGPSPTEMPEAEAARLREAGEEYGATTGRPRRCGWLDLVALGYAVRVTGLDALIVTKLDVLDDFAEIKVAVAYECHGRQVEEFPSGARALESCRPVWKTFRGWQAPTGAVRQWLDLPARARGYLEGVERAGGGPLEGGPVGRAREGGGGPAGGNRGRLGGDGRRASR